MQGMYSVLTLERKIFLLWKERLNSDDQQFYQYQQKKEPPLILTH